ncbi:putative gas1-like protein [Rosellinia necatrix]|uniref:Putative gas1-like protein n=1 Tax=Rosellinia necatrix TaxID=77044 RepID=A0A1W2TIU3_ROSNE|nr:putative gas1-like protein [Rosellinia necatrix]
MQSFSSLLSLAVLLASANAHGVILGAQGIQGSPASVGFKVQSALPRNCTSINPCQQDTTIIRDAEISANIVNECGRTELDGNIDIGENTENALAADAVTQVKAGSTVDVTIHQVNADGAGPYTCDVIAQGNNGVITFPNVQVDDNVPGANGFSQAKEEDFVIKVTMPADLNCTGSSAGNVCTVRCRNNALAGPFGGCFPVQQIDTEAVALRPSDVDTILSLEKVNAQVAQDIKDLPVALAANQADGTDDGIKNAAIVSKLLNISVVSKAAPLQTVAPADATTTAADAVATQDPSNDNSQGNQSGNGRNGRNRGNNNNNNNNNNNKRAARSFVA